jgi:membrane protease YdiL (CAAX protease family)
MLSPKPWQVDRVVWLLAAFLASGSLGVLVVQGYQAALSKDDVKEPAGMLVMLLGTLTYQGVALALIGVFLRLHQIGWREAFGFNSPRLVRTLILGVFTCCLILPIALTLNDLSKKLLEHLGMHPEAQHTVQALQQSNNFAQQVYFGIMAIFIAPFVEEIIFRGILYPTIKQLGYRKTALWGTSLFFAATHVNAMTFVPLTFMAVVLTLLYETTDNLLAPIVAHSLFNAANFLWLLHEMPATSPA